MEDYYYVSCARHCCYVLTHINIFVQTILGGGNYYNNFTDEKLR